MSVAEPTAPTSPSRPPEPSRALALSQLATVTKLELRKLLLSRRTIPILMLCGLPLFVVLMFALFVPASELNESMGEIRIQFSFVYHLLLIGPVLFFGSATTFINLFRGEVMDRSLHFYLLSPIKRWALVGGKYLAGILSSFALFGGVTMVTYLLFFLPFGLERLVQDFTSGPGFANLLGYLGTTFMGCLGYGAVFLLLGILFRNPILPLAGFATWEAMQAVLPLVPAVMRKLSIVHYLVGMVPIPLSEGPFALVGERPSTFTSVLGLLGLTVLALSVAVFKLQRAQIEYGDE